jgi:hypothetical protein
VVLAVLADLAEPLLPTTPHLGLLELVAVEVLPHHRLEEMADVVEVLRFFQAVLALVRKETTVALETSLTAVEVAD